MSKDKAVYYATPRFIIGDEAYERLIEHSKMVIERKYGKGAGGIPCLLLDGKGGSFALVDPGEE